MDFWAAIEAPPNEHTDGRSAAVGARLGAPGGANAPVDVLQHNKERRKNEHSAAPASSKQNTNANGRCMARVDDVCRRAAGAWRR